MLADKDVRDFRGGYHEAFQGIALRPRRRSRARRRPRRSGSTGSSRSAIPMPTTAICSSCSASRARPSIRTGASRTAPISSTRCRRSSPFRSTISRSAAPSLATATSTAPASQASSPNISPSSPAAARRPFPRSPARFDANDLVVVSIGGNDARAYERSLGLNPSAAQISGLIAGVPAQAATRVTEATAGLTALVNAGARNITFLAGDVGRLPEVAGLPSPRSAPLMRLPSTTACRRRSPISRTRA